MKINTINYLVNDAFKSLKRNKTISIASVITVIITFFVLGVFVLVAQNANQMIAGLEDKIEIQSKSEENILNYLREIETSQNFRNFGEIHDQDKNQKHYFNCEVDYAKFKKHYENTKK